MSEIECFLDWQGQCRAIGILRRHPSRGRESVTFQYDPSWLAAPDNFSIEPALPLGPGTFAPHAGREMFGTLGDSAPDRWGRMLMQRHERRNAAREGRAIRTLHEADFLLGVSDETRLGAIRFRRAGEKVFQAPQTRGVPTTVALGDLLNAAQRIEAGDETDDDLQMIFAPGSSLGGARPKASVFDQHGSLSIAKFPKETDEWSLEIWEAAALDMAEQAGMLVAEHSLETLNGGARVNGPVFLSRRFDRVDGQRIPFLSAMSLTGHQDGDRGSYLDLVDAISEHGARPEDLTELYRRVAFSILVSNVDDHMRNHAFLWLGTRGWALSPAYDINPTPVDVKPRILSTAIDLDNADCSVELLRETAGCYNLRQAEADQIIREVADVTQQWREFAQRRGASKGEIDRMSSAFEHDDLIQALAL